MRMRESISRSVASPMKGAPTPTKGSPTHTQTKDRQLAPASPAPPAASSGESSGILRQLRPYLIGASIIPVVATLYLARGVLIPVALAGLLTFLLSPVVGALERVGLWRVKGGRIYAVMLVVVLVFSALGGAAWVVAQQVLTLGAELPHYRVNLKRKISDIRGARQHGTLAEMQSAAKEVMGELQKDQAAKGERTPVPVVVKSDSVSVWPISKVLEAVGGASFVLVLVIFMLIEQQEIRNRFIRLTGHGRLASVTRGLDEAAERISRYLIAQTMINAAYGTALGLGLFFIGVPYAVTWGFLAFALRFIPYLGPFMAALGPIVLSLAVFDNWQRPLFTIGLFLTVELLTYMVVEPYLYGQSIGVSQVALLVALAFWTWLWGPIGLVLGTPLTVCLVVLGKHVPALSFIGIMMADEPALPVDVRYYQRLLAKDSVEGTEILDGYLTEHPLIDVYDDVIVPALSRAKRDRVTRRVSAEEAGGVYQAARESVERLADHRPPTDGEHEETGWREDTKDGVPHVLACAAADEGDALALAMLRQLVSPSECHIELASAHALSGEIASFAAEKKPSVVLIAALPPEGLAQARHLCKRLRARRPDIKILVGRWGGADPKAKDDREALLAAGADDVGVTLAQSRDQLLERVRLD
jgi:predicted PurR-regulated permease PerM